jgi:hypothetical protein
MSELKKTFDQNMTQKEQHQEKETLRNEIK